MIPPYFRILLTYVLLFPFLCFSKADERVCDQTLAPTLLEQEPQLEFSVSPGNKTSSLEATVTINGKKISVPHAMVVRLCASLAKASSYASKTAHVRTISTRPSLCNDEIVFLEKRNLVAAQAASGLIGRTIDPAHMPRIAVIGSGGSMHAALALGGLLKSFDASGLLQTTHYVAGVSGSTWLISAWLASGKSYSEFFKDYTERVAEGLIPNTLKGIGGYVGDFVDALAQTFLRRLFYGEIPTIIDFWGLVIGLECLDKKSRDDYSNTSLCSQLQNFSSGNAPCPIYTAINPINKNTAFQWVEFSPFEVMNYGLNAAVPTFGFGRQFNTGTSINNHPPLELGYLMGIWGSAISITLREIYTMFLSNLEPKELFAPLKDLIMETPIGQLRVFPAHIRNPTHDMHGMPDSKSSFHIYLDAGMDINLPFVPLLKPERKVDLIIACDDGGDTYFAGALKNAAAWAKVNNIPFPTIDYHVAESNIFSVFDDGPDSQAPVLIYLPAITNPRFDPNYDPFVKGYHGVTSLEWTQHQIDQITGLMEMAGDEAKQTIVEVIDRLAQRKAAKVY
ncbi:TPA: hypothetical protein DDZ86_04830 [Candidatus Dependentiae bacterium]|nr:MAG: hypothetical protein A2Y17_09635 [Clostridiales bacterium GWF2_38_85]HBL98937.1 hypothetical protein [Candidatus Dependentiae bacterium]